MATEGNAACVFRRPPVVMEQSTNAHGLGAPSQAEQPKKRASIQKGATDRDDDDDDGVAEKITKNPLRDRVFESLS